MKTGTKWSRRALTPYAGVKTIDGQGKPPPQFARNAVRDSVPSMAQTGFAPIVSYAQHWIRTITILVGNRGGLIKTHPVMMAC